MEGAEVSAEQLGSVGLVQGAGPDGGRGGRGWSNLFEATVVMVELDWVLRDGAIKFLTTSGLSGAPPRPALLLFFTTQTMMKTKMSTTMMPREMTRTRILVDSSVVPGKGSCLSTELRGKTLKYDGL